MKILHDSDEFVAFIANEISLGDHHGLFWVIGKKIGLEEDSAMRDVIKGLFQFYREDFDEVEKIIEGSLK